MGLSIQEKFKIDFQDGNCGGNLVFQNGVILATFDLQVTLMIHTKFHLAFRFRRISKYKFLRWPTSWISDRNDFSYFDLPVTLSYEV